MQYSKLILSLVFVMILGASNAHGEIVHLTSGRTLSVSTVRDEGDRFVFGLRGGGEVALERGLVSKIVPDEVPYETAPAAAAAVPAPIFVTEYDEIIEELALEHEIDPNLVRAIIKVESNYKPRARSPKGATGLMQLMPRTARQYGVRNLYDLAENIKAGVMHLKTLLDRFDVRTALAAYNAGEGAVRKYGGVPPYRETRNYVRKILALVGS